MSYDRKGGESVLNESIGFSQEEQIRLTFNLTNLNRELKLSSDLCSIRSNPL